MTVGCLADQGNMYFDTHYRMDAQISSFPLSYFDQDRVKDAKCVRNVIRVEWFLSWKYGHYAVVRVNGQEKRDLAGSSANKRGVQVTKMSNDLYSSVPYDKLVPKVGVISPYRQQVDLLKEAVDK